MTIKAAKIGSSERSISIKREIKASRRRVKVKSLLEFYVLK
jgi:hypothetical protein